MCYSAAISVSVHLSADALSGRPRGSRSIVFSYPEVKAFVDKTWLAGWVDGLVGDWVGKWVSGWVGWSLAGWLAGWVGG